MKENFIKKIFNKAEKTQKVFQVSLKNRQNFQNMIKEESKERERILKLQQSFEKGVLAENEIQIEDKEKIEMLYDEQIQELDINIKKKQEELKQKVDLVNTYYKIAINLKTKNKK